MNKGILIVERSTKGAIYVKLDRLNGKQPMPLAYVAFADTKFNGKECTYLMDKGKILEIKVENIVVYPQASQQEVKKLHAEKQTGHIPSTFSVTKLPDSFSLTDNETCLPKYLRKLASLTDIDNFALKFQKAARCKINNDEEYKFLFYNYDKKDTSKSYEIQPNYGHLTNNFAMLCKRQSSMAASFAKDTRDMSTVVLHPAWRFVVGLGGESVYETNITLHQVYGIPYIPSSSIKGVLRSWVISQIFTNVSDFSADDEKDNPLLNAEYRAITESKLFCEIFGCPADIKKNTVSQNKESVVVTKSALGTESQGKVMFFDAYPTVAPVTKIDIMNPHYPDWYKELNYKAPTDTQSPVPIPFLTISNENNLTLQTCVIAEKQKLKDIDVRYMLFTKDTDLTGSSQLLDLVKHWLTSALTTHGIGAKTAVGYGYMK